MSHGLLRALHGYTAFALAALLLLYAASGWLMIHGIEWGRPDEATSRVPLMALAAGGPRDAEQAKALALEAAERAGLAGAVARDAKQSADGGWSVSVARVARSAEVTLRPGADAAEVKRRDPPLIEGLKRLHHVTVGGSHGVKLFWAIGVDALALALLGFCLTGVLMFWRLKRDRRLGLALLAGSTLYTLGSIAWLAATR